MEETYGKIDRVLQKIAADNAKKTQSVANGLSSFLQITELVS